MRKYILDDAGNPILCQDTQRWGQWHERFENCFLKRHVIGDLAISTVFLGIDHNFGGGGEPILWESMVVHTLDAEGTFIPCELAGELMEIMRRYRSREAAIEGHAEIVAEVKRRLAAHGWTAELVEKSCPDPTEATDE